LKKIFVIGILGFLVLLVSACTTRLGAFTVISTRNIEWNRAGEYTRGGERVEGSDVAHIILFISTKSAVDMQTAVDDALDQMPGAVAIIDAVLSLRSWNAILYGQVAYIVTGTALIDPVIAGQASLDDSASRYLAFSYNDDGILEKTVITEAEYHDYLESL
jgi:hypothetical protein